MKKEIITKTINGYIYWLRILADGENEEQFIKIAKSFYTHNQDGHRVFIDCCLKNKYVAEDLKEKCHKDLFTKLQFGFCPKKDFDIEIKKIEASEDLFDKKLEDFVLRKKKTQVEEEPKRSPSLPESEPPIEDKENDDLNLKSSSEDYYSNKQYFKKC